MANKLQLSREKDTSAQQFTCSYSFRLELEVVDQSRWERKFWNELWRKCLKDSNPTPVLEIASSRELVDLDVVNAGLQVVEHNGHATATHRQERHVVNRAGVQCTCVAMVLDAVQCLRAIPIQDINANVDGLVPPCLLLLAVAPTSCHDSKDHVTISGILQLLQTHKCLFTQSYKRVQFFFFSQFISEDKIMYNKLAETAPIVFWCI